MTTYVGKHNSSGRYQYYKMFGYEITYHFKRTNFYLNCVGRPIFDKEYFVIVDILKKQIYVERWDDSIIQLRIQLGNYIPMTS